MLHMISVVICLCSISRALWSRWFVILIMWNCSLSNSWIVRTFADWTNNWAASCSCVSRNIRSLLAIIDVICSNVNVICIVLVTDLNICEVILIIAVNCSCYVVRTNSTTSRSTLRNTSLISIDKSILSCIVMFILVIEWVASNLNLSSVKKNFTVFSVRWTLSLSWFPASRFRFLLLKSASLREYSELHLFHCAFCHVSFGEFPSRYTFSHSWSV